MALSPFGKREWVSILGIGAAATVACLALGWWIVAAFLLLLTVFLLGFFRDPRRNVPSLRGLMVSPADGKVSSIHDVDHFEPFDGPAKCIRIFLSVFDVHVNRSPCHGRVVAIHRREGEYINALKPESAEKNEAVMIVLHHPTTRKPVAAVRQIAGTIARRIVTATTVDDILQRGQRYGMIKFGSTTELYLPHPDKVTVEVREGQRVAGGSSVLASVSSPD